VALQGIFAMLGPGPYPLKLEATLPDGSKQSFEQSIIVKLPDPPYPNDPMLTVDPETIDPAITVPESQQIATITAPATPDKLWQGIFQLPVDPDYCLKSRFGNRRAYNGGGFDNFHAGLDFGICSPIHPFDIYAPADGVVVFTGKLIVRGNATIIDHGWGIYTGYWHQEEILVNVGDHVKTGQLIGKIGQTGRVTGPHLHWEVWVNGVQVNPTEWLNKSYP
jgi:murein DD-endopeptidase MepM/ murein hydrolase activator NlpD